MRIDIDIEELAGELWARLRPEIDQASCQALPALLSRRDNQPHWNLEVGHQYLLPMRRLKEEASCL